MGTKRKIYEKSEAGHTVKIYWDRDWSEYTVRLDGYKPGEYYTTDKQDATETALAMLSTTTNQKGA
jgi:hypothetical protein